MNAQPYPVTASPEEAAPASLLSSRRGVAILLLLSLVQFMDVLDASILNIALPSIKTDLGFTQQSLQWVVNGYILTYGGFLLLGGRLRDRRRSRRLVRWPPHGGTGMALGAVHQRPVQRDRFHRRIRPAQA